MRERYNELLALIGEEAKDYLPLIEKAEEDASISDNTQSSENNNQQSEINNQ